MEDAVPARVLTRLLSALLLARFALVAARFGALALVEGDSTGITRHGRRGHHRGRDGGWLASRRERLIFMTRRETYHWENAGIEITDG